MDKDTANFLRLMNENNNAIAERKAKEQVLVGVDPIREKRDAERRERFGQLRAHSHSRSQETGAQRLFRSTS